MSMEKEPFGAAEKYTIWGAGDLSVSILTYGATIQAIRYRGIDVALGYNTLEDYQQMPGYLGATIGRYANRIAGGKFRLHGQLYDVGCNEEGRGHLHGGRKGLDKKIWRAEVLNGTTLRCSTLLEDKEEGYPGEMKVQVTFSVEENTLHIFYEGTTDQDTVFNPTNHCYFNLNGQGGAPITNHLMQINAAAFTPVDAMLIPTGQLLPIKGTPFDFQNPKPIGLEIDAADPQLKLGFGYDHNYVLSGGTELKMAATAFSSASNIEMSCYTTLPGLQFYTGNCLNNEKGKSGPMGKRQGFCLETQFFPDSPNHPSFPSCVLKAGETYSSVTEYRFSTH